MSIDSKWSTSSVIILMGLVFIIFNVILTIPNIKMRTKFGCELRYGRPSVAQRLASQVQLVRRLLFENTPILAPKIEKKWVHPTIKLETKFKYFKLLEISGLEDLLHNIGCFQL